MCLVDRGAGDQTGWRHAAGIGKVTALPKSKLLVEVEPAAKEELVVNSEGSARFKKWLGR